MESKPITYIGMIDVGGVRQGYFLSKNLEALTQVWDRVKCPLKLIETKREYRFYDLVDVTEDVDPADPSIEASMFLKGEEVIYVPVNAVSAGMLRRILPNMGQRLTTEQYMKEAYPLLILNPLLESAIICDLYLFTPVNTVLETYPKN